MQAAATRLSTSSRTSASPSASDGGRCSPRRSRARRHSTGCRNLLHATGAGGQLGFYALDRLDTAEENFSHSLELEDVMNLSAIDRCDRLA
eukprot:641182-Prymnesium_polylepis.1